jgi:hypothetical protein
MGRRVHKVVAGGLEHTVVITPRWHPVTPFLPMGLVAGVVRLLTIGVAAVLRWLLCRREWTVTVFRQQIGPVGYEEYLHTENHPSEQAALARAAEIAEALRAGRDL